MIGSPRSTACPVAVRDDAPPGAATVPAMIRAQAERTPDAVAVESAGDRLTYAQLLAEAAGLAEHLRGAGVRPGDLVAVAVPRGLDLVPTLLGVQFTGAAYVPLDPEHPADRLDYIVEHSRARVLVTADAAGCRGLRVDTRVAVNDVAVRRGATPATAPDPDSAAYVIYTSGSTGRPKGVMVTHRALANFVVSIRERPGLPEGAVLPAVTTVSFDIAALELFVPLTAGGRVVVAGPSETADPRRLASLLAAAGARTMQATPVTWRLLLEAGWSPPRGFTVLCGGERLPVALADRLLGDDVVLWDLYGPTETTVWSSTTRYERGVPTTFAPVRATTLHVLDERLLPVAPGAVGELYIGGAGVAVGYLGRADLTAARFVADPFGTTGTRMYRTGDVARRHADGRIEILGREDFQLKIRGFRIEPGEVEHLLTGHPGVAEAVVRAFGDNEDTAGLVAYVRPVDPADPPAAGQLRQHLARFAPAYMIPARFVVLDRFPRTPSGKTDRAALPDPAGPVGDAGRPSADRRQGSTTELLIAGILAEVLQQPTIGVHEDFFALGGDSLRAVQIVLRLNEELATEIPINALFETRTVYGLAALLDAEGGPTAPPVPLADGHRRRLSAAQLRLWLHQRSAPHSTVDNGVAVVRLRGPVDLAGLESAVTDLLRRHPLLRTCYEQDGSELPVPVTIPAAPVRLTAQDGDPRTVLARELARPFDLAAAPPVRIRLVHQVSDDSFVLLMVLHRIAADDGSCELIARQVRASYRGRTVPAPVIGYDDYAEWRRTFSAGPAAGRHLDFWREALAGLDSAELPTDRPRPDTRDWRCGTVRFAVPPRTVRALEAFAAERAASGSTALLAAFSATLARHSHGTDLAVGVPVAGRDRPELENLVGMLEETAVVRVDLGGRPGFADVLERVGEAWRAAVDHAVVPFEDIVGAVAETVGTASAPTRNPLFDAFFTVQEPPSDPGGLFLPDASGTRFDLCCRLAERPDGGIDGRFEYAAQLFDEATVTRLTADFVQLLTEVAGGSAA